MTSSFYKICFWFMAIRGILRRQHLRLPPEPLVYRYRFSISQQVKKKWFRLYGIPDLTEEIPFTYFWPLAVKSFLQFIQSLRVRYKNVLHFKHEANFLDFQAALTPSTSYS